MTRDGRPLRFLALVMTGWVSARAVMLWPVAPPAVAREAPPGHAVTAAPVATMPVAARPMVRVPFLASVDAPPPTPLVVQPMPQRPMAPAPLLSIMPGPERPPGLIAGLPAPLAWRAPDDRSRFFGSFWALARRGNGPPGGVPGVQLGGSQAGIRLGYALTEDRRVAVVGRASSPLGRGMRELALGIEVQPTRLPLRLVAEQRFALGAGRGGPTLAAIGGVGPVPLLAGFALESYAQGGVIARGGAEGFVDGALRFARPVATFGRVRIDLGGGAWGAAQRGATRLDVGPSLSAILPIGPQPVRLSLDWRQRVAGNASPDSGLVVTLGADF